MNAHRCLQGPSALSGWQTVPSALPIGHIPGHTCHQRCHRRPRWRESLLTTKCRPAEDSLQPSATQLAHPPQSTDEATSPASSSSSNGGNGHAAHAQATPRLPSHELQQTPAPTSSSTPTATSSSSASTSTDATRETAASTSAAVPAAAVATQPTNEVTRLLSLALPLMVQNVVGYAAAVINLAYVGALGATELSAFVLGSSIYNVCGLSVALGLSTGMDTLAGSAYGAKEYGKLGLILQRAVLVCWAACVPVAIAWVTSDKLLLALGQQPEISHLAAQLLTLWVPCLFLSVLAECVKRFLQAQRQVQALAVSGLVGVLSAPLWFHLCMTVGGLGLTGSALASSLIQLTILAGLVGFSVYRNISLRGSEEQPWRGWRLRDAAKGWREYLDYGVPAAVMICLEWWVYEAVVIMSGWLPDPAALASMGICVNLNAWAYMLPMGLSAAVNTSVANALGAGDAQQAARAFRTGLGLACCLQIALAITVATLGRHVVPYLCPDAAVCQFTLGLLPVLASVIVVDGINAVISGTLRGAGRANLGATVNAVCCALALPAAWVFSFPMGLGAHGFWLGVLVGAVTQTVLLLGVLLRAKGGEKSGTVQKSENGVVKKSEGGGGKKSESEYGGKWWQWDWDQEARRLQGVAVSSYAH